jgi:hypothetical protein
VRRHGAGIDWRAAAHRDGAVRQQNILNPGCLLMFCRVTSRMGDQRTRSASTSNQHSASPASIESDEDSPLLLTPKIRMFV